MLKNEINSLIAEAMKNRETERLDTLRLIKNQLLVLEKSGQEYTEGTELKTLLKMVSSHEDSIKQFKEANRIDLVEKEENELKIIKEFIPEQPSDDEITDYTNYVIKKFLVNNHLSETDLGMKHMKPILMLVEAKYDTPNVGKIVSETLKNKIIIK